jgi:magnesium transporter
VALLFNYLVAALVASLIPLTLHRLRADPAAASSVFVTACTDLCGFFSFLGLLSIGLRFFA